MTVLSCDSPENMYGIDCQNILKTTVLPPTPPSSHSSRMSSPLPIAEVTPAEEQNEPAKKKKKKKTKKPARAKELPPRQKDNEGPEDRPPVLCISRNKHWRYISSYHVRPSVLCRNVLPYTF